jgi:uncharacterized protein (TIGR03067 family)
MKVQALLVVVAAGLLVAADAKDDAVKAAKAKLKGAWKVVTLEEQGEKAPEDVVNKMRLVFQDDKLVIKGTDDGDHEAKYSIDPSQKPASLDLVPADGQEKGKTLRCIYSLEGDDLKICSATKADDDRPKEFAAKKGDKAVLLVFKREKQ